MFPHHHARKRIFLFRTKLRKTNYKIPSTISWILQEYLYVHYVHWKRFQNITSCCFWLIHQKYIFRIWIKAYSIHLMCIRNNLFIILQCIWFPWKWYSQYSQIILYIDGDVNIFSQTSLLLSKQTRKKRERTSTVLKAIKITLTD